MGTGESVAGEIKLASATRPALEGGVYTVKISQTLEGDSKLNDSNVKSAEYAFDCTAERYKIAPETVYSVYPPKESYGIFERVIPHIVLRRRTLPWERPGPGGMPGVPWIALLLFDETEDARLQTLSQEEAFTEGGRCYCPPCAENPEDGCTVLDIEAGLFRAICPSLEELPYLAHSRGVCRDNKVTQEDFIDEWLSVVVANRLPASAPTETGLKNIACLVSLEDFGQYFTQFANHETLPGGGGYVRLPVLAHWNFYSHTEEFNFKCIFEGLSAGAIAPEIPLCMPPEASDLLERGFVPLNHQLRDGGNTVSWYHGPLLPCSSEKAGPTVSYFSDARMIYEEEMGMFDVSYSAAFQLGRMLGLQSGSFSAALERWRRDDLRGASELLCAGAIEQRLGFKSEGAADLQARMDEFAAGILFSRDNDCDNINENGED